MGHTLRVLTAVVGVAVILLMVASTSLVRARRDRFYGEQKQRQQQAGQRVQEDSVESLASDAASPAPVAARTSYPQLAAEDSDSAHGSESESAAEESRGAGGGHDVAAAAKIRHESELRDGMFVLVRSVKADRHIGLPQAYEDVGHAGGGGVPLSSVLRLHRLQHDTTHVWALQSSLGTYLSAESNERLSLDRKKPRSMERFAIQFPKGLKGHATFRCHVSKKHLVGKAGGGGGGKGEGVPGLRSKKTTAADAAAAFEIHAVACTHPLCRTNFTTAYKSSSVRAGGLQALAASVDAHESSSGSGGNAAGVVLFTSPKPMKDATRAAHQRQIFAAWGRLPYFTPLIISQDEDVLKEAKEHGLRTDTHLELQTEFNQPTYRSLFKTAFRHAAPAPSLVMYSNSDILYTPSLSESLDAVLRFREAHHPGAPLLVIGQRTNVNVPEGYEIDGEGAWTDDVEELERRGELFQPDAEDYFLVSQETYDWDAMPDFVVGGAAFDNWFVSQVIKSRKVLVVDVTRTATVVHQNHDMHRKCGSKCSLTTPKSAYNTMLSKTHGGTSGGTTLDCHYATVRTLSGIKVLTRDQFYL
eukprot:Rhum_TRINITY_DN5682_c0_g1::Rhum_TRINITY_DN5682_c0_g1_i1::g.18040::m.18040